MFIDIDYSKRIQEVRLHLAKPNKKVIDIIDEKFNDKISIKLGNINQLDFSIPYFVDDSDGNKISNPHVDSIKEKMLIRVTLGAYKEWYIVDSIEEDAQDSDVFNVTAFSLGYELKGKRVSEYTEDAINATDLLTNLLEPTIWKIDTVDPMFDVMYRSFDSGDDSNVLDCITNAGETYGALIVWDTENRKISFKDATKNGQFKGMTVDYGKFINSIKRTRTTDEMVTRLYVYGSDGLTIIEKNPTGQAYLENFGYFMYPFTRDANKNVITHSDFMSDELCNALLDHEAYVEQNSSDIQNLQTQLATYNTQMVTLKSDLTELNNDMTTIQGLLDTANSTGDQTTIDARKADKVAKQTQIDSKNTDISNLQKSIDSTTSQLNQLQEQISMDTTFTQDLKDELNLYIIESVWKDDRYIDPQELYDDAVEKFDEIRQPKVVIDVTIENLLNIIEEQYYWDKINLGDLIKVRYPQMNIEYMAKIIQIDYDLQNSGISLTIANTTDLLSETDKLIQLLYSSSNATTAVQNNKYKWNKVNIVETQVSTLLTSEWDATKNKIIAGVNNSIEVGNRGIIIKNPDFPDEIVIMQSGVIALSKDGGETWKTAIKPDGIVAERLIGQVIAGDELLITNSNGTFTLDNNGARFNVGSFVIDTGTGENYVDSFINTSNFVDEFKDDGMLTAYEKKMTKIEWDKINTSFSSNDTKIDYYYGSTVGNYDFIMSYYDSYNQLHDYLFVDLNGGSEPILADDNMVNTTRIDKVTFDNKFTNYYTAEDKIDEQLSIKMKDLADQAQKSANDAQNMIDEVSNDVVYKTELHSTNGDIFNNGDINTTLYVVVYKGKDDITSTLPVSAFVWKKIKSDGTSDTTWNNAHVGVGNTIKVTKDDVDKKSTFWVDIDIE